MPFNLLVALTVLILLHALTLSKSGNASVLLIGLAPALLVAVVGLALRVYRWVDARRGSPFRRCLAILPMILTTGCDWSLEDISQAAGDWLASLEALPPESLCPIEQRIMHDLQQKLRNLINEPNDEGALEVTRIQMSVLGL